MLFPTTLVGSYPQPEWLIDRQRLAGRFPPRVRARELWRVAEPRLAEAQNDATVLAIRAQEEAGLDIITDGEIRRESYSNRFATALEGVDIDNPGTALDRSGHQRPSGYSFLPELAGSPVRQISIETAQSRLDCSVLAKLEGKSILLGCLDLDDPAVEAPETIVGRVKRALPHVRPERVVLAPDCGMKYLPRDVAFAKLKSMVAAAVMLRAEFGG